MRAALRMVVGVCVLVASASGSEGTTPREFGSAVILVTLDGVRAQEFFRGPEERLLSPIEKNHIGEDLFAFVHSGSARGAITLGRPGGPYRFEVANRSFMSLPAYQSIFAGKVTPCHSNNCGRITAETFPERLLADLDLGRNSVAVIASWPKLALAAARDKNAVFTNAGVQPMSDGTVDWFDELAALNRVQVKEPAPWDDARADRHTWAQAMRFLDVHRPKFLSIHLNDSDAWGHLGNYSNYLNSLRTYDGWLRELNERLATMGPYGQDAWVIVTTDHGRGEGAQWTEHGSGYPSAREIWAWIRPPMHKVLAANSTSDPPPGRSWRMPAASGGQTWIFRHTDIRTWVESILGSRNTIDAPRVPFLSSDPWGGKGVSLSSDG